MAFRFDVELYRAISHYVVQKALDGKGPLWLREGLAECDTMRQNPEWKPSALEPLISLMRNGRDFTLEQLDSELLGVLDHLARVYATLAVQEWMEKYKSEKIQILVARIKKGEDWKKAVEETLGKKLEALNRETREAILKRYARVKMVDCMKYSPTVAARGADFSDQSKVDMVQIYLLRKRYGDARKMLDGLLKKDSPLTRAVLLSGRLAQETGDLKLARDRILVGLKLEKLRNESLAEGADYEALGRACQKLERPDEAVAAFRKAIELDPQDGRDECAYAELLKLLGKKEPKTEDYYQILEKRLQARLLDVDGRMELGRWHEKRGESEKALDWYLSAAGIRPEWVDIYQAIGPLAWKLKNYEVARFGYQMIHEIRQEDNEALEKMAQCSDLMMANMRSGEAKK